jgi:hypothetical protein
LLLTIDLAVCSSLSAAVGQQLLIHLSDLTEWPETQEKYVRGARCYMPTPGENKANRSFIDHHNQSY